MKKETRSLFASVRTFSRKICRSIGQINSPSTIKVKGPQRKIKAVTAAGVLKAAAVTAQLDKIGEHNYIKIMNATAKLMKEIETMPEETAVQVLDFTMFIKSKRTPTQTSSRITIKEAFGVFKGINTHFEREENDRV